MQLTPTLTTLAVTGFGMAFLHAAIPTHWLPFVLVGRERGWSHQKTLAVTISAGLGHVALTSLLGLGIAWFGYEVLDVVGENFRWVAAGILAAMGCYYFWRQWTGRGICHHHAPGSTHHADAHCGKEEEHTHLEDELRTSRLVSPRVNDSAAMGGLFMMLTLSPCEAFLPVYILGAKYGWLGFVVLSLILAVAALGAMVLFTWLTLVGFNRVRIRKFERKEAGLLGMIFMALAVAVLFLEHHHH